MSHTPGPWTIGRTVIGEKAIYRKNEEEGKTITETYICKMMLLVPNPANYDEYDANTTLIAHAPEMLKALEDVKFYLDNRHEGEIRYDKTPEEYIQGIIDMITPIINKAKGI